MLRIISRFIFFFSSRRRHTRFDCDWSSDVCSSDLLACSVGNSPKTYRNQAGSVEQLLVLKDLAVIFAVSLLVILAFHRVKLPPLPGFIVAGVLLGPNALGLVSDVHRVEGLAAVGVVLLLFTIGIEFSLSRLREMGRQVLVGGGLQVGLTADR